MDHFDVIVLGADVVDLWSRGTSLVKISRCSYVRFCTNEKGPGVIRGLSSGMIGAGL